VVEVELDVEVDELVVLELVVDCVETVDCVVEVEELVVDCVEAVE